MTNRFRSTRRSALTTAALPAENPDEKIETLVPGVRPSLANPLEAKCASQIFVDVLAAEDVGKVPDRNVTEAFSVLVA